MTVTEVESRVSEVTVYRGRALITREVSLNLEEGEHTLLFTDMPSSLDRNSIQVKGIGEAVLGSCVFETQHFTADVNEQASSLLTRQQELTDHAESLELQKKRLEGETAFIERIASFVTTPHVSKDDTDFSCRNNVDVSSWEEITQFYRERRTAIDLETLEIRTNLRNLQKEQQKIARELKAIGHTSTRSRDIIRVNLKKTTEGELTLDLSYSVNGPSWKPVYNLRAAENSNKLNLEYDAVVTQSTGENWENIALRLSTARISISGVMPELSPWRISLYRPSAQAYSEPGMKMKRAFKPDELLDSMADSQEAELCNTPAPMMINEAQVEESGSSVFFKVAGTSSINGDNTETRVTLSRAELPAEYLYRSVPKLSEFAYRTARLTNTSEFPLLPGKVNIYHEGSLISTSEFKLIMPGEETEVSLGVHEGIKVEYRFLKKFRKNEGLLNKKTSMQFEYMIELRNNTGHAAEIEVFDQLPVSQEKEIEVKTIAPEIDGKNITINDEAEITWHLNLASGEKRELPFTYLVEYPVDRTVTGL